MLTRYRASRPDWLQRLVRPLKGDYPGLGCSLSFLGILNDLADVKVKLGGQLLPDCSYFFNDWIMKHC